MGVLRLFTPQRRESGVLEAAELLERPRSTVSRFPGAMRAAGFLDRGEEGRSRVPMQPDRVAVAAPVRDHRGEVVAALSAPAPRVPRELLPAIGAQVADAARTLSRTPGCATC